MIQQKGDEYRDINPPPMLLQSLFTILQGNV